MTFLIFYVPDPVITINYSQVIQPTGGGGGTSDSRVFNFVDADLDVNGNISFTHDLEHTFVDYSVFMPTVGEVSSDSDNYAINVLTVNLKSFRPLVGLWTILIEV